MSPCVDKNPIVPGSFPLLLSSFYSSPTPLLHLLSTLLLHIRLGGVIRSRSSLQIVRRFWAAKNVTMVMRFWLKPDNSINRHRRQDLRASTPGLLAITSSSSLLCVSSFLRPKYTKCVPNVAGWVRMQKNYIGICCCRRRRRRNHLCKGKWNRVLKESNRTIIIKLIKNVLSSAVSFDFVFILDTVQTPFACNPSIRTAADWVRTALTTFGWYLRLFALSSFALAVVSALMSVQLQQNFHKWSSCKVSEYCNLVKPPECTLECIFSMTFANRRRNRMSKAEGHRVMTFDKISSRNSAAVKKKCLLLTLHKLQKQCA